MDKICRIITHPGSAHRDDFLCCCILLAISGNVPVEIYRRNPTVQELGDPEVYIVDVGNRHEPQYNNYDHHGIYPNKCALTLLLDGLADDGYYHAGVLKDIVHWMEFTEHVDTQGPKATAKWLGIDAGAMQKTISPIETHILHLFEQFATVQLAGENLNTALYRMMYEIGSSILSYVDKYTQRKEFLKAYAAWHKTPKGIDVLMVLVDELPDPALAMYDFRKDCLPLEIAVNVVPDDRGAGYALYRFDDDPRIDFSLLEKHEDIVFAHHGGFIAKTHNKLPASRLLKLIDLAVTGGK